MSSAAAEALRVWFRDPARTGGLRAPRAACVHSPPLLASSSRPPLSPCSDPFACSYAGQQIPLTLAQTSTDKYTCSAADVLDDAKRAYIRNTIIPAALDL